MIKTVLFDLDGTLLPMNQELFVNTYIKLLQDFFKKHGYDEKKLTETLHKGIKAMYKNDGSFSNEERFWNEFKDVYGDDIIKDIPLFDQFYHTDFQSLISTCSPTIKTKEIINFLNQNQIQIIIATNPLFPKIATGYRLQWSGIDTKDILHFTTYEDYSFTKPSLNYYQSILEKYHLDPKECLMVGNDIDEDMIVSQLGIDVFLLTDCLINRHNTDINIYNHGSFDDLKEYIAKKL